MPCSHAAKLLSPFQLHCACAPVIAVEAAYMFCRSANIGRRFVTNNVLFSLIAVVVAKGGSVGVGGAGGSKDGNIALGILGTCFFLEAGFFYLKCRDRNSEDGDAGEMGCCGEVLYYLFAVLVIGVMALLHKLLQEEALIALYGVIVIVPCVTWLVWKLVAMCRRRARVQPGQARERRELGDVPRRGAPRPARGVLLGD